MRRLLFVGLTGVLGCLPSADDPKNCKVNPNLCTAAQYCSEDEVCRDLPDLAPVPPDLSDPVVLTVFITKYEGTGSVSVRSLSGVGIDLGTGFDGDGGTGITSLCDQAKCEVKVPPGTKLKLTAIPSPGSYWGGWGVISDCQGDELECMLTPRAATNVEAQFTRANETFVTKAEYTINQVKAAGQGDMRRGADALCAQAAAGTPQLLNRTWRAWLATSSSNAATSLANTKSHGSRGSRGWVRLYRDVPVLDASNSDRWYYPIQQTEEGARPFFGGAGAAVFSGSTWDGKYSAGFECDGWVQQDKTYSTWTTGDTPGVWRYHNCNFASHIYCFETGFWAVVPAPVMPTPHHILFTSGAPFNPSSGRDAANKLCETEAAAARANGRIPSGGIFKALLAGDGFNALKDFGVLDSARVVRADGLIVANSVSALIATPPKPWAAVLQTASGSTPRDGVWTGAQSFSTAGTAATTCQNWSSNSAQSTGQVGDAWVATSGLAYSGESKCNEERSVYCLELNP